MLIYEFDHILKTPWTFDYANYEKDNTYNIIVFYECNYNLFTFLEPCYQMKVYIIIAHMSNY